MQLVSGEQLTKSYSNSILDKVHGEQQTEVLKAVDISLEKNDFTGVMGKSGCGKTTLLKILGTIDRPTKGKVCYFGKDIKRYTDSEIAELRRKRIGFVFQDFQLMDSLSVEENIMLPLILDGQKGNELIQKVSGKAEFFEIHHILKKYPSEISGGEKQRVAIARALIHDPDVIFADEPTGNLDSVSAFHVMKYLTRIHQELQKAVMLVTHDPLIASYCNQIIFLKDGAVIDILEKERDENFYNQIMEKMRSL